MEEKKYSEEARILLTRDEEHFKDLLLGILSEAVGYQVREAKYRNLGPNGLAGICIAEVRLLRLANDRLIKNINKLVERYESQSQMHLYFNKEREEENENLWRK